MADLLTHAASAALPGSALRDGRVRAVLYVGVCLPDVLYKLVLYAFGASTWVCEITHAPLALLPLCYFMALFFEEEWRRRAFSALLAGSWLHVLVDLGKDYLGHGVILWAFPFSMDRIELGFYRNADALVLMVPSALLILALEALMARRRRPAAGSGILGR